MAAPLTDDERQQIASLIEQGLSRNEIARQVGRGAATITKIASEIGHAFDRSETKTATHARRVDLEAERLALAEELLADARRLREQLWQPAVTRQALVVKDGGEFAGQHVEIVDIETPEPTFADKQRIMTSVGIATDKVLAISKHDVKPDEGGEQAMLVQLVDSLREQHAPEPEAS